MGHDLLCYLIMLLLLDMTMELACIWTKCVWWSQTTLLLLFVNSFCNNYVNSDVWDTCEMDVTCGLLCWIEYNLGCMQVGLKSFVVLVDYQVYMGSSMTVWSLWWLLSYLCSYKLVGSITAGIGAWFNIKHVICVFKTKVFVCKNQFWQLIDTYIEVCSNLKFYVSVPVVISSMPK